MPQMAQLADFMRFQAYGAAPAAVRRQRASFGLSTGVCDLCGGGCGCRLVIACVPVRM